MKLTYTDQRQAQLRRKLELYLGSGNDWLHAYGDWCAENDVGEGQAYEDHNITLFVKHQRKVK